MTPTKTIKVTHIASGDLWAGAEAQLFTLCSSLQKISSMELSVILLNHGELERKLLSLNIPVLVIDETIYNSFIIYKKIFSWIKRNQPDIVHTHRTKENILGGLASYFAGITSIRTSHGAPEHSLNYLKPHKIMINILDKLTGQFLQKKIIAVSDELKEILAHSFPREKIDTIENGIDTESLKPYSSLKEYKEEKKYKVGIAGRLTQVKRIDKFIKVASHIRNTHPNFHINFHIYGDGPLKNDLKSLIHSLSLSNTVILEGLSNNIYSDIASLDALLITSDHEGLPLVLLESMGLGTPVITNNVGGISKVCQGNTFCWMVDNSTIEEIADNLVNCLTDFETRTNKAKSAIQHIETNYSANINAHRVYDTYQTLLA